MPDRLTLRPLPVLRGERVILRERREPDIDDRLRYPIDPRRRGQLRLVVAAGLGWPPLPHPRAPGGRPWANVLAGQAAQLEDPATRAKAEAAQARIADYDAQISRYRASLDAGADPAVIGPWIAETQAKKVTAQAEVRTAPVGAR
jgi:hypothetical protein